MKSFAKVLGAIVLVSFLTVGNAMAFTFGNSWDGPNNDLQDIFDEVIIGGELDAYDYSDASSWTQSEADVDSYLISMVRGHDGVLGVYSTDTGAEYDLMTTGLETQVSFGINDSGALWIDNAEIDADFGQEFGFYWKNTTQPLMSYTDASKNAEGSGYGDDGENMLALTYLVTDGLSVSTPLNGGTTVDAKGNDDWILAFEDWAKNNPSKEGDSDYNDAVFYIEDMQASPEPATMLLLGVGLIGLAAIRKKFNKKA